MRLTQEQALAIRHCVAQLTVPSTGVWLFGSRVDDQARGGDVDLMVELDTQVLEPAILAAQVSTLMSRSMFRRKVDVLIQAPNMLQLPIHSIVRTEGLLL